MTRSGSPTPWLRRAVRAGLVPVFARLGLDARALTALHLLVGLLAAGAIALGPGTFLPGACLVAVGMLFERAADERAGVDAAARARSQAVTMLVHLLAFIGLGVGLLGGQYGVKALGMGIAAGVAVALLPWLVRRLERIDGRRATEFDGAFGVEPADLLALLPLALVLGWAEGLLTVVSFAAPAFATAFWLTHYRKFHG